MKKIYICEYCNTEIDWEGMDDIKGTIWYDFCNTNYKKECKLLK